MILKGVRFFLGNIFECRWQYKLSIFYGWKGNSTLFPFLQTRVVRIVQTLGSVTLFSSFYYVLYIWIYFLHLIGISICYTNGYILMIPSMFINTLFTNIFTKSYILVVCLYLIYRYNIVICQPLILFLLLCWVLSKFYTL